SAREFEELMSERLLENVRTMKRRVANGIAHPEILAAMAWCNLTSRSVFHRLYEKEEKRLEEATGRITDLERELTRGGEDTGPPEEFRRFRDSRIRFDRQAMDRNLRAKHVVDLKHAIGEVLQKFDISGLAADDIDEALELVEEVEPDGGDDAFWDPCLNRVLAAVELYDDGVGPLRTNITGLAHLGLESWELAAARRTVANGAVISDFDRALLKAAALRANADSEAETLAEHGEAPPPPEPVKSARASLARVAQVDHLLQEMVEQIGSSSQEVRWLTRTRFRLLRSTSDLWLRLDSTQPATRSF
ncbi:MAG TPA: hypothetical protein VIZ69_01845, partial [Thermoanaerobaculia bacterium]